VNDMCSLSKARSSCGRIETIPSMVSPVAKDWTYVCAEPCNGEFLRWMSTLTKCPQSLVRNAEFILILSTEKLSRKAVESRLNIISDQAVFIYSYSSQMTNAIATESPAKLKTRQTNHRAECIVLSTSSRHCMLNL
jgi:hypothetical protein